MKNDKKGRAKTWKISEKLRGRGSSEKRKLFVTEKNCVYLRRRRCESEKIGTGVENRVTVPQRERVPGDEGRPVVAGTENRVFGKFSRFELFPRIFRFAVFSENGPSL